MATKKKRLTQRERAERAAAKKRLQARGVLPPDKPRLNRKKFAQETWAEWTALLAENRLGAAMALCRAVRFTTAPELLEVTPEQAGILDSPETWAGRFGRDMTVGEAVGIMGKLLAWMRTAGESPAG